MGGCDSIKGGNFNSISLINRQKLAPKLGLIDLIRGEFGEVAGPTGKWLLDVRGQIALEISLSPPRRGRKGTAHLANCHQPSSREGKLLPPRRDPLGMQPVCAAQSLPCAGGTHDEKQQNRVLVKQSKTCPSALEPTRVRCREVEDMQPPVGTCVVPRIRIPRGKGEAQMEAHGFKATTPPPPHNTTSTNTE